MNKTKKLLANLGPNVTNENIQRIINKDGDLHHFYEHIADGGEIQHIEFSRFELKILKLNRPAKEYRIKPTKRKAFMVGCVELKEPPLTLSNVGPDYYLADVNNGTYRFETFDYHSCDHRNIEAGASFETKKGAQAFLNAVGWRDVDVD